MNSATQKFISRLLALARGLRNRSRARRKGQTTVEYLLMLAVVVGMALAVVLGFNEKILGSLFTLVGMVLGAGTPTTP